MFDNHFRQIISITAKGEDHEDCLRMVRRIKKQCDVWDFSVDYTEHKSARKAPVLRRDLMIYHTDSASNILIFKEVIRRLCAKIDPFNKDLKFTDRGIDEIR